MATTRPTASKSAHARPGYYRGIRLVKPAVPARIPLDGIERAVKAAFEKNAAALSETE